MQTNTSISLRRKMILLLALLTGCSSSVASHRNRIHDLYAARDDILALSAQIQDIAQIMLYAGRIHSGPLADAALDVAIAIHGQPDDREKAYAQHITLEQVRADGERVSRLLAQRDALRRSIDSSRARVADDLAHLHALEAKYDFASKLISSCAIGIGILIFAFLAFKFLL
jgi:hypothetical protein